ncbi:MAG: hypothetical protein ACRDSK_02925 [Actinophytocola sp.]|uniref:hypothetical protein n=1 Tax=Actinophytocola sp. TaxID=1872138 RepID=UPI003D6B8823
MWDTTLKVLRDPLFAVGLSLVLAILASRVGGCVARLLLGIGAVAAFVWLLVRFEPFENVVVSIVSVIGTVLVVLLICLALLAIVAILAVHSMHQRETHREARRTHTPLPPREPVLGQEHRLAGFVEVHERLETIASSLVDIDDDTGIRSMIGRMAGAYFGGLTPYMPEIRELTAETSRLLLELVDSDTSGLDRFRLRQVATARTYLPSRDELAELWDEDLPWYAYRALRLLCVHRQWRALATVFSKCQYGMLVVSGEPI